MAKQQKGILEAFTGKIGNVVGSSWKGIPVLRSAPSTRKSRFSNPQIQQQAKFIVITRFLRPLTELINQTFKNSATKMSCFNKAFSVNKETVIGLYPSFKINYAAVVLSTGKLYNATDVKTRSPKPGRLLISWNKDKGLNSRALISDHVFVAAYCEELDKWFCNSNSASRYEGSCNLDLSDFKGRQVQTYMGFISYDGKNSSNSLYLGKINIS
jgi:hypothetical protein